jgi:hypothetical protein
MKTFLGNVTRFLSAGHLLTGQVADDLYEALGQGATSLDTWVTPMTDAAAQLTNPRTHKGDKVNLKKALRNAWYDVEWAYSDVQARPADAEQIRQDLQQTFDDLRVSFFHPLESASRWQGPGGYTGLTGSTPTPTSAPLVNATQAVLNYATEFGTAGQQGHLPLDPSGDANDGPLSGAAWSAARTVAALASTFSQDMHNGFAQTGVALRDYTSRLTDIHSRGAQEIEALVRGRSADSMSGPLSWGLAVPTAALVGVQHGADSLWQQAKPIIDTIVHHPGPLLKEAGNEIGRQFAQAPGAISETGDLVAGGAREFHDEAADLLRRSGLT